MIAYERALEVVTRKDMPTQWAMTQINLGNALATLGAREEGTKRLEAAVTAYERALEVVTREAAPHRWALTLENMARAKLALFDRTQDRGHLDAALRSVTGALEVYTAGGAAYDIGTATRLRGDIQARLRA